MRWLLLSISLIGSLLPGPPPSQAASLLDAFSPPSDAVARTAWRAVGAAPPVARGTAGGLVFTCPFNGELDRVYWDREVALDLSSATRLELDLDCPNPVALRSLAIYLHSGSGWYIWNKPIPEAGRQRLALAKRDFATEGTPAGWDKIDRIRFSPWRGSPQSTKITAYRLTAHRDTRFVVQATQSAPAGAERAFAKRTAERVSGWLTHAGVAHAIVDEETLLRGLPDAKLIILPYNPSPGAPLLAALRRASANGAALVACFSQSEELASLLGVKLGAVVQSKETGRFAGMVFPDAAAWRLPDRVYQHSWTVREAVPADKGTQVIAWWINALGARQPQPAWLASPRGLWMTHVLMDDDRAGKERLLTALLGRYDPTVWAEAAEQAAASAGRLDGFNGLTGALDGIRRIAAGQPNAEQVEARLAAALATHRAMLTHRHAGRHADAGDAAHAVRRQLAEAYSMAQPARPGELRGVWEHDGVGWYPGDWVRTCRELKEAGINALFVNTLWAGLAHYPSKVVPSSDTNRRLGDQMAAALAAARKHGLQVHAWKVCWLVENAPAAFREKLKAEGRLQQNDKGATLPWLNPALAANRELELAALEELARTYALDGIHLDYVRYPDAQACYAPASRKAFEAWLGRAVGPWPAAVRTGSDRTAYERWRAQNITDFVRAAGKRIKAANPRLKVSAAVWGGYPDTIASIGQDWGRWLKDGAVDFVCPMNYTEDTFRFAALVQQQTTLPGAQGRIYPGIGVTSGESQLRPDEVVEQIATVRRAGAPGFLLFDLSQDLRREVLPVLQQGVTR